MKRFVYVWFRYFETDGFTRRNISLAKKAFVLAHPDHGRMMITTVNPIAESHGILPGMTVADAKVSVPGLQVQDTNTETSLKWLQGLAAHSIRFSPFIAIDPPDGLVIDATGCAHLWGTEDDYIKHISKTFSSLGYTTRTVMADTIGAAWAIAHYDKEKTVVRANQQLQALLKLPVAALRIEATVTERLNALGLKLISSIIAMPRSALRRRFGENLLTRLDHAIGNKDEILEPVQPVEPYHERLQSLDPITNLTGIEIGLEKLLEQLCDRLKKEQKGLRIAKFKCFRIDGIIEEIKIGTHRPTFNAAHLLKLFSLKFETIAPGPGIDLFLLEAHNVEPVTAIQEKFWQGTSGLENPFLSELLDRYAQKLGADRIHRYLPAAHHWPEGSFKTAISLDEKNSIPWFKSRPRPVQLLSKPERIEVTAPVPDYPPMNFRYKGKLHKILKADGPERIEQEWWLQQGVHRDYYYVEDEEGKRYWVFRAGHYGKNYEWYLHGFFA